MGVEAWCAAAVRAAGGSLWYAGVMDRHALGERL